MSNSGTIYRASQKSSLNSKKKITNKWNYCYCVKNKRWYYYTLVFQLRINYICGEKQSWWAIKQVSATGVNRLKQKPRRWWHSRSSHGDCANSYNNKRHLIEVNRGDQFCRIQAFSTFCQIKRVFHSSLPRQFTPFLECSTLNYKKINIFTAATFP